MPTHPRIVVLLVVLAFEVITVGCLTHWSQAGAALFELIGIGTAIPGAIWAINGEPK